MLVTVLALSAVAIWLVATEGQRHATFLGARDSQKWLGDYAGLAWARGNLYAAFVDNSKISSHVAFYRTASPPN